MTQQGAKVRKPTGSSLLKISQDERAGLEEGFREGNWVKTTTRALTAPIGRLM